MAARAMRVVCERFEARMPSSALTTGGFHSTRCFSPAGAPLSVMARTGASISPAPSSSGLAIVAELRMNVGVVP